MLQKRTAKNTNGVNGAGTNSDARNGTTKAYDNAKTKASTFKSKIFCPVLFALLILVAVVVFGKVPKATKPISATPIAVDAKPTPKGNIKQTAKENTKDDKISFDRTLENLAFEKVVSRTKEKRDHCNSIGETMKNEGSAPMTINNHTVHLPAFGFMDAVETYMDSHPESVDDSHPYSCELPPESECGETQFTVIFMAYNPDRLKKMIKEIQNMLIAKEYAQMVAEVIIVWNGERHIDESPMGKQLLSMGEKLPLRISYPLKDGFVNDLLNRYHPRLEVKTKAVLYYDDDGPFYSKDAISGGFELWKRNSNAQIGAMARKIDLSKRQAKESGSTLAAAPADGRDKAFVSHCPADDVNYNYFTFTNYDARMVLPSGSFLHSNYLCFIWHPIFEDIRKYVRAHPVNPDDGTVSMLVSQLAGRAPRVYSRRVSPAEEPKEQQRRRLMDGINWDRKGDSKSHDKKMFWGQLRSDVANSLARYFGSINSGSYGWCEGTDYHITKKGHDLCNPEFAKVGMLPWMNADNSAGGICI